MKNVHCLTLVLSLITLLPAAAVAQDLDPRRYINLPVNQNFVRVAYGHSEGDVNVSPSLPLEDAALTIDGV
jgi:hypothetical protein